MSTFYFLSFSPLLSVTRLLARSSLTRSLWSCLIILSLSIFAHKYCANGSEKFAIESRESDKCFYNNLRNVAIFFLSFFLYFATSPKNEFVFRVTYAARLSNDSFSFSSLTLSLPNSSHDNLIISRPMRKKIRLLFLDACKKKIEVTGILHFLINCQFHK